MTVCDGISKTETANMKLSQRDMIMHSIPVLNLNDFFSDPDRFVNQLQSACSDIGFFSITGHNIQPSITTDMREALDAFFALLFVQSFSKSGPKASPFKIYLCLCKKASFHKKVHYLVSLELCPLLLINHSLS